jgi:hypothetical protein
MRSATLLALFLPIPMFGQATAQNAAVKYLRADAALRQAYPLSTDGAQKLEKALESPLDEEDENLVRAADEALVELQHGANLKSCDWAISAEDGPLANTAHRGAISELVAVSGIRARIRFHNRDSRGAVDDMIAAMAATRHLSLDGSLASVLIAYRLETAVASILAQNLNLLSTPQLRELTVRLDALPSGSTLDKALEDEEISRSSLLLIANGATTRDELTHRLLTMAPALRSDRQFVEEIIDGCNGSVSGFLRCVQQQQTFASSWARRFVLTPEDFQKEYDSELSLASKANSVIRLLTPNFSRLRWAKAYIQTRRALLRSAIAIQVDGPKAVKEYVDPYDQKPFAYTHLTNGFRLESRLKEAQTAISLAVGTN